MTCSSGKMSLKGMTKDKPQDKEKPIILKLGEQNSKQGDKQAQGPSLETTMVVSRHKMKPHVAKV